MTMPHTQQSRKIVHLDLDAYTVSNLGADRQMRLDKRVNMPSLWEEECKERLR